MKKIFLLLPIVFLAAACNSSSQTTLNQPSQVPIAPGQPGVNTNQQSPPQNSNQNVSNQGAPSFHCKDLLPDADFQSITGIDSSKVQLDEKVDNTDDPTLDCIFNSQNSQANYFNLTLTLIHDVNKASGYASVADQFSQTRSIALSNSFIKMTDRPDITVGSGAYSMADSSGHPIDSGIALLSSNKKYEITLTYGDVGFGSGSGIKSDATISILKTVDANLNRY